MYAYTRMITHIFNKVFLIVYTYFLSQIVTYRLHVIL